MLKDQKEEMKKLQRESATLHERIEEMEKRNEKMRNEFAHTNATLVEYYEAFGVY